MRPILLVAAFLAAACPALAISPDEVLRDPALEARARDLGRELRCLVCQNQAIDDSNAPLAVDLRRVVRERLTAGDSDGEVKDYLVSRYGDFVLLEPPFRAGTILLWFGPLAVLAAGAALVVGFYRRRDTGGPGELSTAERAALDRLLTDGAGRER